MRPLPSIIPGIDRDTYLVFDDFGRAGRAWGGGFFVQVGRECGDEDTAQDHRKLHKSECLSSRIADRCPHPKTIKASWSESS
jgi:hypothetical protein